MAYNLNYNLGTKYEHDQKKRHGLIIFIIILVLVVIGVLIWIGFRGNARPEEATKNKPVTPLFTDVQKQKILEPISSKSNYPDTQKQKILTQGQPAPSGKAAINQQATSSSQYGDSQKQQILQEGTIKP